MAQKTYDPKKYVVYFNGERVRGYADGTFISIERDEDTYSKSVGAQGDTTRVRSNNKGGMATVTLQAESPTNEQFSNMHELDEEFGTGWGVFMMKDLNGTTVATSDAAWIKKPANIEGSTDAGNREWQIDLTDLKMHVGASL